ncbi:hypothetical protein HY837_05585 [archaeon]|nr:hypothetical protein [archaeon]
MSIAEYVRQTLDPTQEPIAEGKSKKVIAVDDTTCVMAFKPHLRSITSKREENIEGTDYWRILNTLDTMNYLSSLGIPTSLAHNKAVRVNDKVYLVTKHVKPIPIEWIVRYEAAGSIVRLFPSLVKAGQKFETPLFKYDLKQDIKVAGTDDPTLNESYIVGLGLLNEQDLARAKQMLGAIGEALKDRLDKVGIALVDVKMEYGFCGDKICVIDEISQDCMRAYDKETGKSLTKDLFRQMKSHEEIVRAYEAFAKRLNPNVESLIE